MLPVLMFPQFNPVLVHVGPFAIRWYALSYIIGIVLGITLLRRLVNLPPRAGTPELADDFLAWVTLGILMGGRLGYVLFYQPGYYITHPLAMLEVWHGGMSFHGGALGVIIAMMLFTWRHKLNFLAFADRVTIAVPIGLGLGRVANFINGELWGREAPASLPWAMIFPDGGPIPRHPSQIYEALTEGLLLFLVMFAASRKLSIRQHPGFLAGLFLAGYACARSFCEFFREPDSFLGFLPGGITMGQLLCCPMLAAGIALMVYANRHPVYEGIPPEAEAKP
ncbi:prolipoprotein diacylglyceryl transferase [Acetobacter pasteurianus]|uniref:Phosphatidylglycerol--prolipoprotein diacylglyceryl transferase n=2 Tax=Acetobacter pasteurianus TaxID=438 RepID=A0A401X5C0_ACEPA|nr:prolipoprotein diacylglyceryl transferase [Acetobacter pasteurianus]BAU39416.1 prolipoprotein diacylglycerol transferase [Acetobacter pasteurianus NBRC 101655]OAZ57931.1 Prolipoprotein diacylglyceryl transferase [Acetobacter pasteurianus]CCT59234.1 prolipoprotein diacylglycerol transferase [Acetobacter pasteurianus 386B]GAB30465.1 prolipoprotein diacylglyceryl transferase [Acetobacter pasteurianus subsp. pasteurianus LMG 1262 = NBRC 106471]GCD50553.1 prolipoprotein diacylglycerol transferas